MIIAAMARRNHKNRQPQQPANKKLVEQTEFLKTLSSALLSRKKFAESLGFQFSGQRSLYDVLGYKTVLTFQDYYAAYDRGDIAQRIVDAPAITTWRHKPIVSNGGDPNKLTDFETAWLKLVQNRKVFHYLERADKLAGIGEYGALIIGTDDIRNQDDFVRPMVKLRKGIDSVLYLTPLTQEFAEVRTTDSDPTSERFGLPETYAVQVSETNNLASESTIARNARILVHWSRIIHISEGLRDNDIYGTPRLKHVMNRLDDVNKIAGGSAEIFWQAAKRIMVMQAKDGFSPVEGDDTLTEMMDEMIHGLRRVIDVQGYEVKTLENSDVKPDEAFRVALALISSATGIPQRILLGSEQGKMASEQDETNWNSRIMDRQTNWAETVVLRPFIDRLVEVKALPTPGDNYRISWPSLFELSDKEKAQVGLLKARALGQYMGPNAMNFEYSQHVMSIPEFRTEILGLHNEKTEAQLGQDDSANEEVAIIPGPPPLTAKQPGSTAPTVPGVTTTPEKGDSSAP